MKKKIKIKNFDGKVTELEKEIPEVDRHESRRQVRKEDTG